MRVTLDNGDVFKSFRRPITFQKTAKRWFIVIPIKGNQIIVHPVKHVVRITR